MKALFVRFGASGGPNFFGPAIVIPDLDYTTVLIGQDGSILVNYACPEILRKAKVLKEFDMSAKIIRKIISHHSWGYRLREKFHTHKEDAESIFRDLELQHQIDLKE